MSRDLRERPYEDPPPPSRPRMSEAEADSLENADELDRETGETIDLYERELKRAS
jgi:hypothetical protein